MCMFCEQFVNENSRISDFGVLKLCMMEWITGTSNTTDFFWGKHWKFISKCKIGRMYYVTRIDGCLSISNIIWNMYYLTLAKKNIFIWIICIISCICTNPPAHSYYINRMPSRWFHFIFFVPVIPLCYSIGSYACLLSGCRMRDGRHSQPLSLLALETRAFWKRNG
jgi:hypothetical protein